MGEVVLKTRMTLIQIKELVAAWSGCACSGACPLCVDRMTRIEELIDETLEELA